MFNSKFDINANPSISCVKLDLQPSAYPTFSLLLLNYMWINEKAKKTMNSDVKAWACAET